MWNFSLRRQSADRAPANEDDLTERLAELTKVNKQLQTQLEAQSQKQVALEESEAKLSDVARAASDWMWVQDENLRFSYFSDEFALANGDTTSDFLGKTRWEMGEVNPSNEEKWREHKACLRAREAFRDFRFSCRTRSDKVEHYKSSGVPYFDQSGKFLGYRGTANCETDEVLKQQKASQLEQSYREIYENAAVGIFRATPEGEFLQANPALYKLFDFPDEEEFLEAVNTAPENLFPEPVLRIAIKREIDKKGVLDGFETKLRDRTHGRSVWVSITASRIKDEKGNVKYFEGMVQDVSKHKTAEAELKRRERELAQAQRIGRSGHWRWYVKEGVIERSEEMCRLLGISTENTLSSKEDGDSFIHPQDRRAFQARQQHAIAQGIAYRSEHRVLMPDGEIRFHSCEGHPERNSVGQVVSIFGINRDVTEKKEAENALRESERQLNEAQRLGHIGHWRFCSRRRATRWSHELWRIFGLEPQDRDLSLDEIFAKMHAHDRKRMQEASSQAWENLEHFTQEYRIIRPDGSIRYVKVEGHPELDSSGDLIAYFGVTQDVTEQTEADAALKESNARNLAIVEALDRANVGLSIANIERGITDVNSAVLKIAGLTSKDQMIGLKLTDLNQYSETDFAALRQENYDAIENQGSWLGEFDWQRPDGEVRHLSVRSAPFIGDSIVHLIADVTEQKRRERREAELEEGLKQSQKMEALGQLAGGIAHEINNLLHPIINFTKLTLNKTTDAQLNHYLARALECSRKAADIVNDILTFAHKGSGDRTVVNLAELTARTMRFAQDITPPDIKLTLQANEEEVPAEVNETEFIQVILNLVQNANDAMGGVGEVRLLLDCVELNSTETETLEIEKGHYARVTVNDRGQGIPDDVMEHIFEPFFTTKEVGRGTGLGLAVVYGIVKGWNGAISVKSEKDVGSSFEVYVPIVREAEKASESKGV